MPRRGHLVPGDRVVLSGNFYLRRATSPVEQVDLDEGPFVSCNETGMVLASRVNEIKAGQDLLVLLPGPRIGWVYERLGLLVAVP